MGEIDMPVVLGEWSVLDGGHDRSRRTIYDRLESRSREPLGEEERLADESRPNVR